MFKLLLKDPCIELVVRLELEKFFPLIIEQVCLALITTPNPSGEIVASSALEISLVKFSWTWSLFENISITFGILDKPMIFPSGI